MSDVICVDCGFDLFSFATRHFVSVLITSVLIIVLIIAALHVFWDVAGA